MDEHRVLGEAGETWTLCVPRVGAPNKAAIQGTPVMTWVLSPTMGDVLERSLRNLSPSLRRGRPLLYRADRELLPEQPDEAEQRELLAARSTASDPAEAAAIYEAVSMKTLSRELSLDLERKRRELDEVKREIADARTLLEKERERQRRLVADEEKAGQKLVAESRAHHHALLRASWTLEDDLEEKGTRSLRRLGEQIDLATSAKMNIDRIMRATTFGELIASLKGHVEVAMNSPIGKSIGLAVAAKLASVVAARTTGKKVTTEDALAAIIQEGAQFRERQQQLQELLVAAADGDRKARAQGLVLGATFVAGGVEPRVIGEYIAGRT